MTMIGGLRLFGADRPMFITVVFYNDDFIPPDHRSCAAITPPPGGGLTSYLLSNLFCVESRHHHMNLGDLLHSVLQHDCDDEDIVLWNPYKGSPRSIMPSGDRHTSLVLQKACGGCLLTDRFFPYVYPSALKVGDEQSFRPQHIFHLLVRTFTLLLVVVSVITCFLVLSPSK